VIARKNKNEAKLNILGSTELNPNELRPPNMRPK
jgi:hypothetical protein